MEYRSLGNTEIKVSVIAFGCWAIAGGPTWGDQNKKDAIDALHAAYDEGITFFDTAEVYGNGKSEQILAEALSGVRDEIVIASKVLPVHYKRDDLRKACERSLRNLSTDYIDLYQMHWPNGDIPLADTLEILEELKVEGKIREYGVSNFGCADFEECLNKDYSIVSNQVAYNLLFRSIEYEIKPLCLRNDISMLCYSPLLHGLLTGKFSSPDDVPEGRGRTRHFSQNRPQIRHDEDGAEEETFNVLNMIRKISENMGTPMATLSLAWLIAQEGVNSVIMGGRNRDQVIRNSKAGDMKLQQGVISCLSEITEDLKQILGTNADMWQSKSRININ